MWPHFECGSIGEFFTEGKWIDVPIAECGNGKKAKNTPLDDEVSHT